jgi:translocator protein
VKKKGVKKIHFGFLILSFVSVYIVALAGSLFTIPGVASFWYQTVKPSITPPGWVFPVVWNILFFLIALSLYFLLTTVDKKSLQFKIEIVFAINFLLNFMWSFFYFGLRNPLFAFYDLIALWLSIFSMIYIAWKIDKKSAWLLLPYLLWVTFAGILNYLSIVI